MKQILCFGDSNTWGLIPKTNKRYEWGVRWTSLLNESLNDKKEGGYRVIEEGLCGRTTVFDDPLRDGRNGVKILPTILETHNPVDIVIIMLGTNDCKTVYNASAEFIGQGVKRLIGQVKNYIPDSKILVISPIHLGEGVWESDYDPEFSSASVSLSKELSDNLPPKQNNHLPFVLHGRIPNNINSLLLTQLHTLHISYETLSISTNLILCSDFPRNCS